MKSLLTSWFPEANVQPPPELLKVMSQKGLPVPAVVMVLPVVAEVNVTVELAELKVPPVASQQLIPPAQETEMV